MTFQDLPSDWPMRSLTDPRLAADVVDLVVSDADRRAGGLSFLLCRWDGSLGQPVFVATEGCEDLGEVVRLMVGTIQDEMPGLTGMVLALARPCGGLTDEDRRLHQLALDLCRARGFALHGTYLATGGGVEHLPVVLSPSAVDQRPGAA